jgi:hypothetical protein
MYSLGRDLSETEKNGRRFLLSVVVLAPRPDLYVESSATKNRAHILPKDTKILMVMVSCRCVS